MFWCDFFLCYKIKGYIFGLNSKFQEDYSTLLWLLSIKLLKLFEVAHSDSTSSFFLMSRTIKLETFGHVGCWKNEI